MIPVSPINGLVRTATFIQEEWDDILSKEAIVTGDDTTNAWLSLLLVNQAVINQADALAKLATATMDDGLTRSWALYNAASRRPIPHPETNTCDSQLWPSASPKVCQNSAWKTS
jgi:endo-1,3(4)-beta-glucanase